ncbi:hypothetical protein HS088_TW06G00024 [Tripterygium wilfordii]|uniref:Uncharacterized protein n=1 Tax=Tripterygium wilfordii TaxID=458696 RepID=A0A7J7DHM3_TRIWF|nr:hypothetical protein HS088_TW06G00024 [Tripterygium wilfordii]
MGTSDGDDRDYEPVVDDEEPSFDGEENIDNDIPMSFTLTMRHSVSKEPSLSPFVALLISLAPPNPLLPLPLKGSGSQNQILTPRSSSS